MWLINIFVVVAKKSETASWSCGQECIRCDSVTIRLNFEALYMYVKDK